MWYGVGVVWYGVVLRFVVSDGVARAKALLWRVAVAAASPTAAPPDEGGRGKGEWMRGGSCKGVDKEVGDIRGVDIRKHQRGIDMRVDTRGGRYEGRQEDRSYDYCHSTCRMYCASSRADDVSDDSPCVRASSCISTSPPLNSSPR